MTRKILWFVNIGIFAVFFNLIFFLSIENYSATRWISYAGIMIAFFCNSIALFTSPNSRDVVVHSYTRLMLTTSYFILEIIFGLLFILINNDSYIFPLIVQGGIFVFYGTWFTFLMLAEDSSVNSDIKQRQDFQFYKRASAEMEDIISNISDRNLSKMVEKAYDAVKGMQPVGFSSTQCVENDILLNISLLRNNLNEGKEVSSEIDKIRKLVSDRNRTINSNQ